MIWKKVLWGPKRRNHLYFQGKALDMHILAHPEENIHALDHPDFLSNNLPKRNISVLLYFLSFAFPVINVYCDVIYPIKINVISLLWLIISSSWLLLFYLMLSWSGNYHSIVHLQFLFFSLSESILFASSFL